MKQKKYRLRVGSVFFMFGLILSLYAGFFISQNTGRFRVTGQPQPFDVKDFLHFIPGINSLTSFAYGGPIGIIIGAIILSLLYGLVGAIIGGVYGKIKNRNNKVQQG